MRGVSWSDVTTVTKRKSHRGLDLDLSLSAEGKHQEGLEGERWDEVEDKTGEERKQPQRKTQVHMHGWDDACKADLSHGRCDVTPMCINGRRAVCSILRVVHVHVRDGVLVVHRFVLKHDVVVRKVVRNVVAIYT